MSTTPASALALAGRDRRALYVLRSGRAPETEREPDERGGSRGYGEA